MFYNTFRDAAYNLRLYYFTTLVKRDAVFRLFGR